jgi:hypothetical protein
VRVVLLECAENSIFVGALRKDADEALQGLTVRLGSKKTFYEQVVYYLTRLPST